MISQIKNVFHGFHINSYFAFLHGSAVFYLMTQLCIKMQKSDSFQNIVYPDIFGE